MGILSKIGWLASGATKLLPGINRLAFYAVSGLAIAGMVATWAFHKGAEGKGAAVAEARAACKVKISRIEAQAQRTVADILSSVNEQADPSENVAQYCERHPGLCRDAEQ